jgi:citrate lyase subunit beta / citryl-CoA lyase
MSAGESQAAAARPRRSALYVPGSNTRALEKACELAADSLILDLEDSVAPEAKESARQAVLAALRRGGFGPREIVVRVNGLDTQWGPADLAAVAGTAADAVLLPKVAGPGEVAAAGAALARAGGRGELAIWCMLETPRAVLQAPEIAAAPGVAVLVMGTSDLAKELRVEPGGDRLALGYSLGACILAARAAGRAILDGVYLDIRDAAGFERECRQAKQLGFDGKTLIHPSTIELANQVFRPSDAELAAARRTLAAFRAARQAGKGLAVLDGRLIEALHAAEAERILTLGRRIAARETAAG